MLLLGVERFPSCLTLHVSDVTQNGALFYLAFEINKGM